MLTVGKLLITKNWPRLLFLLIIAAGAVAVVLATDFGAEVNLAGVKQKAAALKLFVQHHYALSVLAFIAVYAVLNVYLPVAAALTLLGGYLYGVLPGAIYADIGGLIAAIITFFVTRALLGRRIQQYWAQSLQTFNREFAAYGYRYLLMLRLIPLLPFFVVNTLAGLTRVSFVTFLWTTFAGSFPAILIFTYIGRQLATIQSSADVFTFRVLLAFILLTLFAVCSIILRCRAAWRAPTQENPHHEKFARRDD